LYKEKGLIWTEIQLRDFLWTRDFDGNFLPQGGWQWSPS